MILCPRITLGIYQTFNWAWLAMGWNISHVRWTGQHKGWLKVDKDEPLHLKTFIYISISSYNQLGRIQYHITSQQLMQLIQHLNAYPMHPQSIHKASTMHTQPLWKYKIIELELRMILQVQYYEINHYNCIIKH